jgi:DnaK suppressor protein
MSTIERADTDIQQDVVATLGGVGLPLNVSVKSGVVTLEGVVLSEEEREAAVDLVQYVDGVTDVEDSMEILETGVGQPILFYGALTSPDEWDLEPGDDWTTDERKAVEDGDSYTPPTDPPVDIADTPGGIEVASGFQSSSMDDDDEMLGEHDDEDAEYDVHDGAIADNVARELNEDAATTHLNIHVASVQGTVFLTGYVRDPNDGDLAASVAERVPGVRFIVDRLVVGERPATVRRHHVTMARDRTTGRIATPGAAWRSTVARNERWLETELAKVTEQIRERKEDLAAFGRDQAAEGSVSNHQGDIASDVATAGALNTEIVNLEDEVDAIHELQRMMKVGRYGICVDCGQYIDPARLRAFPLAMRCIRCQQHFEEQSSPAGYRRGIE